MAFKIAKGSLFAYLLRSPWWYSALIGLFVIAVSVGITEGQYIALCIAGAFPFWGIAGFRAYKQSKQPSAKRVVEVIEQAQKLPAKTIAEKVASNYINSGFQSSEFKGSEAQLVLSKGYRKILLSSKRFKAANTGIEPLKALVAAGERVEATGYLYVSFGEVTTSANKFAESNNIEIIQQQRLAVLFDGEVEID